MSKDKTLDDEYLTLLDDIEHREQRMTNSERTFVDLLRRQIKQDQRPTDKQLVVLGETWDRVTARG